MKKYNEGYALPFVLVVSVVMCLIAVTVMSFSLKNLQVQQASIQRTQAKYEATATIERVVATIQNESSEKVSFSGMYSIPENLRLAVSNTPEDEEPTVWIIAEINVECPGGITVTDILYNEDEGVLTISKHGKTSYLWYEVVDEEIATKFVTGEYNPYTPEEAEEGEQ